MKNIKIGFLPLYVKLYDDGNPNMRVRIDAFAKEIADILGSKENVEVVSADVCRLEEEFKTAVALFEKENVDCIVTLHLAYSPSLQSEKVLAGTKLPIVILDTTPTFDFTSGDDPSPISYNHGIHGVQDMCNLLVRNGKQFFIEAGHYSESDVIDRVIDRVKGIKLASSLKSSRVGTIGGAFAGMGDFRISEDLYGKMGIERVELTSDEAKKYFCAVTDAEIDALIADDEAKYDVDKSIPEDVHRNALRGDLAVRNWISDRKLTAFTANFLNVNRAFGLAGIPFAEADRAMARGIGYAGEGDVLTSAFTGALMSISDEASFIEMFCPDWKNGLIYLSHMGEMNVALSADKPKYMIKAMAYSDIDTTWLCGTFKAGKATLVNLIPIANDSFRVVVSLVDMETPECPKLRGSSTSGWFRPSKSVACFLEAFSTLGGTHHLDLVYGDVRKTAETFAKVMGYEFYEI